MSTMMLLAALLMTQGNGHAYHRGWLKRLPPAPSVPPVQQYNPPSPGTSSGGDQPCEDEGIRFFLR